ncbi:adenylosuccinate synthase [Fulvivirga sedimenti]|uniref:Adenylosuccinate synthetase n=1 Tax=Fulvivirga sedimenti TaxID=2879465 RepID=A0A9X1L2H4_9BACT|nr:adenylosuccinate synthase [Fulvivirga sedimenti]MCA6079262.1 adenylosuccinate synthase [Fulvivirga sedimenti]
MKVDVLLGLQWGDEGKGKIVDYLAKQYDVVARFQGGPNAGHTLEFDGIKHVLHQIPSGIFHSHIRNIIGNGVVLDPVVFRREIEGLQKYEVDVYKNLYISKKAQLILPTHRLLDAAYERVKGAGKIGSTLKGIGPTYQDKIGRLGLRVGDIISGRFDEKYQNLRNRHMQILEQLGEKPDLDTLEKEFFSATDFMQNFQFVESEYMVNDEITQGNRILAEGAQGSLLDIDFGSYPFVTSSNTTASGACSGMGIAPRHIGEVFGIFKAYCTRVGSGPFPTELFDADGELMRNVGNEFGSTTGRPRRCGWIDLPALKYAIMINGVTQLFMMKADVLNEFEHIKACTHYRLSDGTETDIFPYELTDHKITPVYKSLPGWNCSLDGLTEYDQLPMALVEYIAFLEESLGVPVNIVSTGPDRTETIIRKQVVA